MGMNIGGLDGFASGARHGVLDGWGHVIRPRPYGMPGKMGI